MNGSSSGQKRSRCKSIMDAAEKKKILDSKRFTKLENHYISTKIVCKCESGHFS